MRILLTGGLTLEHGSLVPAQFAVEDGRIVPFPTEISPTDRVIDVAGGVVVEIQDIVDGGRDDPLREIIAVRRSRGRIRPVQRFTDRKFAIGRRVGDQRAWGWIVEPAAGPIGVDVGAGL